MESVRTILEHHVLVSGLQFGLANRANLFWAQRRSDRLPRAGRYAVRQPGVKRR
jgi:hypothetical protein